MTSGTISSRPNDLTIQNCLKIMLVHIKPVIANSSKSSFKNSEQSPDNFKNRKTRLRHNQDRILYGISSEASDLIHKMRNSGHCEICGRSVQEVSREVLCLDHDHNTGLLRGIICDRCNMGLGYFDDSIKSLEAALKYLKNKAKQNEFNYYLKEQYAKYQ